LLRSFDIVYKITEVINSTRPITVVATVNIPKPTGNNLVVLKISKIRNKPAIPTVNIARPGIPIKDRGRLIAI
jgi:hypothetical protein